MSKQQLRRNIAKSDQFNRMGFKETREAAEGMMTKEFTSDMVKQMLENANTLVRGNVTIKLAKAYGFCWGVERAVAIAYETRKQYPDDRIWITNEIIHNPIVNQRMREMDIFFVPQEGMKKDLSGIQQRDVVVLPAFGATLEEMQYLNNLGCRIVDTTCPWVSKVWHTLERHRKASCTSIIHGKWKHEETVATSSFADAYLVVLNMDEAMYVTDYILNGGDKAHFLEKFKNAMSDGFDPDTDLDAVGIANQTTMLKSETTAIGKLFERTMMQKFGPAELTQHFVAYDTICDATQERQDAMYELLADKDSIDIMLVVGGFNSSNTSHLQEIAEHAGITSYWVDRPECIGAKNTILCRTSQGEEKVVEDWLPMRSVTIGLTSGASTPDKVVEDVLERVFMLSKLGQPSGA
ncbi:4-hydroxy-3-methylbut-2-enyl diphosphate reductase [Gracilariopsis chorda]|uniref:4-hydroxy-3-methylbut-2-enyl diphosphate reductase n=1 Tax=Gracilariopsis chorda TaxID=448386 RepID=A0A2V3J5Z7_9FLOR|nr:4-hydroxy-3-methylbut-2-enyl diphosphate reductase [Gracilariopsis chorda]|eukprot:PXF49829.1 4-hydroxy-3-methylbut-2-enyl diphosphate reductase [Gracilariopsis chorda]